MGEGRQGGGAVMLSKLMLPQNPIEQLQCRFKELELGFKTWLSQQSLPVEAAVVTATSSLQGAAIGGLMGTFSQEAASLASPRPQANINPQAMASLKQAQALSGGPLVQARNFAVMTGVNAGISCVMKRLRGKEDVESSKPFHPITIYTLMVSMVAAFGSGAVFSLVSGVGGSNQFTNALTSGLFFALVQGGIFKKYEKKFKKGLLTDKTLPLLNDSALRDVSIPPGPRLVILDHIHRALSMAID